MCDFFQRALLYRPHSLGYQT